MSYSSFKLKSGSSGTSGSSGSDGYNAANTFLYKYSTTTSAVDPGDGYLRLNNATMGSATALYIANTDGSTPANNLDSFLASLSSYGSAARRGYIKIQQAQILLIFIYLNFLRLLNKLAALVDGIQLLYLI